MNLRHVGLALVAVTSSAALLAGCTATGGAKSTRTPVSTLPTPVLTSVEPAPSASAADTPLAEPSEPAASPAASPTITLGMPAPSPSEADTPMPTASPADAQPVSTASATPALVAVQPGTPWPLSLGTAFRADGWTAGEYQAPGTATKAPAFAATVNCEAAPAELEYRFLPGTGSLTLGFAQDVLSASSDNTVLFKVLADGRAVTEKAVTFKQGGQVQVPLTGVTVVKIQAATKGACSTSSTALITRATVRG